MKEWFLNLAERDRRILVAGAIVATLIIFWGVLWRPLTVGTSRLRDAVVVKEQLLSDLRRIESLGKQSTSSGVATATQSLVVLVDQTHRAHGLEGSLTRNQPEGADGIRVTFQGASFDSMLGWLAALEHDYGVHVESASLTGGRDPGVVSATLVLRRSSA